MFGSVWLNLEKVINVQSQRGHSPRPGLDRVKEHIQQIRVVIFVVVVVVVVSFFINELRREDR